MKEEKQEIRRLYRSQADKVIAGVCGGIAEYFSIDPVWVRLIALLLVFFDGAGILIYIIAWILVPKNPTQRHVHKDRPESIAEKVAEKASLKIEKKIENLKERDDSSENRLLGFLLVGVGAVLLLRNLFRWFDLRYIVPVALVAFGLYLLGGSRK